MKINLCPMRWDVELQITKSGETLEINGEVFNFSVIPEGAVLPASAVHSDFIIGEVKRVNGELELTIILPHAAEASEEARFPKPIVNPKDGVVELPV